MDTREIFLTSETDPDAYKKFTYILLKFGKLVDASWNG
jgi:hypothetical protein